jgi:tetratricopeptide (TPR) repeat protein
MTFTASSPSPKFWLSLFALAMLVEACSATNTTNEGKHHVAPANSSKFEWGVQHYEAGNYEKAIKVFDGLRKEGAAVPNFDLLAYYLGMSHFRLGHFDVAARELEAFVHASGGRLEAQDARIVLLLAYEKLARWKDASSLAMESDKLTLFQNNRAVLKLVWARALREQGEQLGAKTALDEALPYLDQTGTDDASQAFFADPDRTFPARNGREVAGEEEAPEKTGHADPAVRTLARSRHDLPAAGSRGSKRRSLFPREPLGAPGRSRVGHGISRLRGANPRLPTRRNSASRSTTRSPKNRTRKYLPLAARRGGKVESL